MFIYVSNKQESSPMTPLDIGHLEQMYIIVHHFILIFNKGLPF